jgi:hypothetical protein
VPFTAEVVSAKGECRVGRGIRHLLEAGEGVC